MSFFDISTLFTRHTFWSIFTALSCFPLASNHRTDSGMNLKNDHQKLLLIRFDDETRAILTSNMSYNTK